MWASQLLTLHATRFTRIAFDFTNTSGYVGVKRVEVVLFNCPQWGLSIQTIRLEGSTSLFERGESLTIKNLNSSLTSCELLVRVCLYYQGNPTVSAVTLQFDLAPGSSWVHLAEVSFYASDATCSPDTLISPDPLFTPSSRASS